MKKYAILLGTIVLGLASVLSYAQAPVPFINLPLVPDAAAPGGGEFTLTVNGTGFVSNSVVNWNDTPLATQFVSGSQLTATVPAADIATARTASVTVVNPTPGGGTSNVTFFTVTANEGNSVAFTLDSSPATGADPTSVAVGDFNGDGKLDLAVVNSVSNNLSILLGDGTGHFTLASSPGIGLGYGPSIVAVGDFNGDGKLDLAVSNDCQDFWCAAPATVSILLGDGTGHFTLASNPVVGYYNRSVAVGDFNGDGKLDLAVVGEDWYTGGPNIVSILLGDGTGQFTLASVLTPGIQPALVAVGDFNGDGKLDLAVADICADWSCTSGAVDILLGDGTGNFTWVASSPAVGSWPSSVAVGDFNGDGKLDIAVANLYSNNVSILLGDGTGNFTLASSPAVGVWPWSVAIGDFNGDGKLDLAVANEWYGDLTILLGDGTGNFTGVSLPATGSAPTSVAIGDFNGDGKLDLAVAIQGNNTLSILLQGPLPAVTLSPTSLNFGTQLLRTTSNAQTVTLTDTGGATLDITSIAASANFIQRNNCGSSVAVGASCTINVGFRPQGVGTLTGAITITDNAPFSPQTVSLSGVGTAVTLLPSSLNFGNVPVGTTSQPLTVTFTNIANRALSISGVRLAGNQYGEFAQTNTCGTSVPAGGSCTISVTFTPKRTGTRTATLDVRDNGGASPQTVAVSGTGM
jgi:hypothetical protein